MASNNQKSNPIGVQPPKETQGSDSFDSGIKMQMEAIGVSGTELFAGYFSEEYLQSLRGRKGAKIFDEMRRSESQIAMLMNAVVNPIKSGVWQFEEADGVENAELHKEFIEFCATEMIDWETYLHEALTMIPFGFSVFETIHNVVFNHPKFGTFNGLKALAFRSQKTIERWIIEPSTGELEKIVQWVHGDLVKERPNLLEMDARFCIVHSLQKEGDNYEGIAALRPMYGAWFRKNLYLKIAAIGMEKNAIGTVIGEVPVGKQSADELEKFKNVLANFTAHESSYLMVPSGWKVSILPNNFDAAKIKEMILLENTEMINSLVANFLALGMNGGGGAFALSNDLSDFFLAGIQNYANLICSHWNRKVIPNLIKLNYGQQSAYPKLKATGITDKAGKELAEVVKILSESQAIKPDMKLEEFLRNQFKMPKADPSTSREVKATGALGLGGSPAAPVSAPTQLSERHLKLAESYKKQWDIDKNALKIEMQKGLTALLENYKNQIKSKWNKSSPAGRASIANKLDPKGANQYKSTLKDLLAEIAFNAVEGAKKETPRAVKNIKMSETIQLADAPRGGYFNALPTNIQKIVSAKANLIGDTQAADLQKIVSFQYNSSETATDNLDQILFDIEQKAQETIDGATGGGMSIDAAAGNALASVTNQARLEWFFTPDVLSTIESFTFYNEDPVSQICQELDGKTWAANDPELDQYTPPLHHNCKSRLIPNMVGDSGNPDITRGTPLTQSALDSMTLCECSYHLCDVGGMSGGGQKLADLSPEDQKLISDKIAKLVNEGKDQAQAAAIAYDMLRRGELG